MAVKPIPDGYTSVTPYLIVKGAARALDYYKMAFGADELMRFEGPDGKIMHAEFQIGNARLMLADEMPDHKSPESLGGSGGGLMLYVTDVDQTFERAVARGRQVDEAGREPVLRRPLWFVDRSVRACVDDRNACRRRVRGRDESAHGGRARRARRLSRRQNAQLNQRACTGRA